MRKPGDPFDWSGGHPALDLVNTLDERPSDAPIETLATYDDLVRFTEQAGLIEPSLAARLRPGKGPAATRILRRARALREQLYAVLTAHHARSPAAAAALEAIAKEVRHAHASRAFASAGKSGAIAHRWLSPTSLDVPLHACALAVESLLVGADHDRIHKCGAADCEVYFLDTSKAHRRLWCSMENCGNREKQRRWRLTPRGTPRSTGR
jgi:predicted RNA-binding Zn ribbon-like protein